MANAHSIASGNGSGSGSRPGLARGLTLLAIASATVLLAISLAAGLWAGAGRIGSDDYQRIAAGNELIADTLPPSSFVIGAYLDIVQAAREPQNREAHFAAYRGHKSDYFKQLEHWKTAPIPDDLRKLLAIDSPTILDRFWIEAENNFFPKLEGATSAQGGTDEIVQSVGVLTSRFRAHRAIVERAADMARIYVLEAEQAAASRNAFLGWVFYAAAGGSALLIAGLLFLFGRNVSRPMRQIAGYIAGLADGGTDIEIPCTARADAIGEVARALEAFRHVAESQQEAERAENEARENAARTRAEADAEREARASETDEAVAALAAALNLLAQGNLECRIDAQFADELESLRGDFNNAVETIDGAFRRMTEAVDSMDGSGREIATSSNELVSRTQRQAEAIDRTAATLKEISSTVEKSSQGVENTQTLVGTAKEDAETSGEIVKRALEAMSEIENSSGEINKIISVIDEIAFQTNLLALNAGVEAARAGDAGKGFAVVAQEVRELAQRSALAAKEIKTLISRSSEQVANGSDLVNKTGETLHSISDKVVQISGVVDEIAGGARDQAQALDQLSTAVGEIDRETRENAGLAERTRDAGRELGADYQALIRVLARFRASHPDIADFDDAPRENTRARIVHSSEAPRRAVRAHASRTPRYQTHGNAALQNDWEDPDQW
ncbi:methyl-accepting chemotaxis protein [Oricola sp.]|uniref:methyl-accepting chemotaxis protein n=1 Tax=Oricola sp. TaxID=1979950 RepID=UPI003BA9E96A